MTAGVLRPHATGWAPAWSTSALATDHPAVAATYINLGNVCDSKGDYDAAREYHGKALAIRLRALGADQGGGCDEWWEVRSSMFAEEVFAPLTLGYDGFTGRFSGRSEQPRQGPC